ncbi:MAG: sensor histidine kinase [Acidimicrobiia bacterium]
MPRANSDYVQIVIVGAVVTTLLVLAVFLVNRENSDAVAADAQIAILSESALSAAAGVLNATNFAVVLASHESEAALVDGARKGVEESSGELRARVGRLINAMPTSATGKIQTALRGFESSTQSAIADLEGIAATTGGEVLAEHEKKYRDLEAALTDLRDISTGQILIAGEGAGRAAEAVRYLVVFLLPLGVIVAMWRATRRSAASRILTEELRHAREVSRSKDAFIADVSHELRTPLTGIYGFAAALEDDSTLSSSTREAVGLITTEAAELSRMVDDLVAAGRIDAQAITYDSEPVELCAVIQDVVRPFRRQGVSVEVDDIGIAVIADRVRLRQLLRNLVSNAVKHGGGDIAITAYSRDGVAVIEVIDDGPGVSAEVEDRMFHRYVHSDGSALLEGSVGLGLAIARAFAEGMAGELTYLRSDELTIFEVSLPLAEADMEIAPDSTLSTVSV